MAKSFSAGISTGGKSAKQTVGTYSKNISTGNGPIESKKRTTFSTQLNKDLTRYQETGPYIEQFQDKAETAADWRKRKELVAGAIGNLTSKKGLKDKRLADREDMVDEAMIWLDRDYPVYGYTWDRGTIERVVDELIKDWKKVRGPHERKISVIEQLLNLNKGKEGGGATEDEIIDFLLYDLKTVEYTSDKLKEKGLSLDQQKYIKKEYPKTIWTKDEIKVLIAKSGLSSTVARRTWLSEPHGANYHKSIGWY